MFAGLIEIHGTDADEMLQRGTVEVFHGDEGLAFMLADLVDGANIGMIQGGGCARFAAEALQSRLVLRHFVGQEF